MDITDNILRLRHVKYIDEIIYDPKCIVTIVNKLTNKSYTYGSYVPVTKEEVRYECLDHIVNENENFNSIFNYNPNNYKINITIKR